MTRAMRDQEEIDRRRLRLNDPHVAPLTAYAASLRSADVEVPDFDPLDGGIGARVLFLLEKPGRMTATSGLIGRRIGSGFISRDNDDQTAEAIYTFMCCANLPRHETVIWNVVPWWNKTRAIDKNELREGIEQLRRLVELLPKLRTVVLVGKRAQRARPHLVVSSVEILESDHPSPLVKARWPDRWNAIADDWGKVREFLK